MNDLKKINLLNVGISVATKTQVLEYIVTGLEKNSEKYYIVTPNPELLVIANNNEDYKNVLNSAKIALPDGIGVMWGAWLEGKELGQRITGVDLVKSLCKHVAKRPITVSFLGGGPSVAELTAECLQKEYPGLNVAWSQKEWDKSLLNKRTDILFVAFGSPKQEFFIYDNLKDIPAKVVIGVGGAFDFISGKVPRAPKPLRDVGLEWLFRLIVQPWRFKRQLSLLTFASLIIKERLSFK